MTSETPPEPAGEFAAAPAHGPGPRPELPAGSGEGSHSAMQRLQLLREWDEQAGRAGRVADAKPEELPPDTP
ncbi:hypothetical protein [Ramlibacter rhizophilus]|uniref:Uncharacterized protein n=1 Tax=Ramlibacter rhizophilus TaxID=1781167 RepID=A0A4Z0BFE3_9BURK|nr:hypothetical protein [Ramlibacter rhizophilus]TFY97401.1 hypothetical protein EZ242_17910 [Ramlibacter rhizophilus]